MKKLLVFTFVLMLIFALCACANDAQNEAGNPTESIETTAHTHYYTTETEKASCETDGEITYTCACGHTYSEQLLAIGHDFGEPTVVKKPGIATSGEAKCVCKVCGYENLESLPALTLDEGIQDFMDDLLCDFPEYDSPDQLSCTDIFGWLLWNVPYVSRVMDEQYMITTVYSLDEMDAFTQRYIGKTFDYTPMVRPENEHLKFDFTNRTLTTISGGAGGGGYAYTVEELKDHGNNSYTVRYRAVDPYVEDAIESGNYHYGIFDFKVVDGYIQVSAHNWINE